MSPFYLSSQATRQGANKKEKTAMMALKLSPSEYSLSRFYDPIDDRPRLNNKTLIAAVLVAAAYSVLGVYFAGQRVAMVLDPPRRDDTVIITAVPLPKPPPVETTQAQPEPRPAPQRPVENAQPVMDSPIPTPPRETAEVSGPVEFPTPIIIPQPGPVTTGPVQSSGPPAPTGPFVISNPNWISRPTAVQLNRAFPDRAGRLGVSGRVTLRCAVMASGAVTGCQVLDETPESYGFGRAALSLQRYFQMSPLVVDGQAVNGAQVDIPVGFRFAP
jgi:protein TonB